MTTKRFFLTLIFITTSALSQPAQQQAQPPIVINNIPPQEGFWTGFLKLAIPTIAAAVLASGITLYGVNKTHRHQATENEANRRHLLQVEIAKAEIAAKYKSQDNRWEFRKDVYVTLITTIDQILFTDSIAQVCLIQGQSMPERFQVDQHDTVNKLANASSLASLAMSDSVLSIVTKYISTLPITPTESSNNGKDLATRINAFRAMKKELQAAARKDLWDTPEPEAKAEAAKQT